MKYNESLRPKGIGRKQLAFPVNQNINELTNAEIEFNDNQSQNSVKHEAEAVGARILGLAKSSATAAASDAHKKSQNYPFGMIGITDFALSGLQAITTKTLIPFRTVNVLRGKAMPLMPIGQPFASYTMMGGTYVGIADNRKNYITDGYQVNDIIYTAVSLITDKVRLPEWSTYRIVDEAAFKSYQGLIKKKDISTQDFKKAVEYRKKKTRRFK